MHDIRSDLQERATLIDEHIKGAYATLKGRSGNSKMSEMLE